MTLTRLVTDAFGVVTISLFSLTLILGLLCIYCSLYFQLRVQARASSHLTYFTGPWITRIALILLTIWWGFGEIVRLSFLRQRISLFSGFTWLKDPCTFYILSNLGFAEPSIFLMLAFLLHAALQKRESGTLSQKWNRKTVCCVLLSCLPLFIMQLVLVLVGPKLDDNDDQKDASRAKMIKLFTSTSCNVQGGNIVCTYPLVSIIILGVFVALMVSYVSYIGSLLLSFVINKGLRRRLYLLIFSVVLFLPLRVILLGFSVLARPGSLAYEAIVFCAFLMLLFCALVGICMLVYFPVADSLALGEEVRVVEIQEEIIIPYDDDYYSEGVSLIANQSYLETGRNTLMHR